MTGVKEEEDLQEAVSLSDVEQKIMLAHSPRADADNIRNALLWVIKPFVAVQGLANGHQPVNQALEWLALETLRAQRSRIQPGPIHYRTPRIGQVVNGAVDLPNPSAEYYGFYDVRRYSMRDAYLLAFRVEPPLQRDGMLLHVEHLTDYRNHVEVKTAWARANIHGAGDIPLHSWEPYGWTDDSRDFLWGDLISDGGRQRLSYLANDVFADRRLNGIVGDALPLGETLIFEIRPWLWRRTGGWIFADLEYTEVAQVLANDSEARFAMTANRSSSSPHLDQPPNVPLDDESGLRPFKLQCDLTHYEVGSVGLRLLGMAKACHFKLTMAIRDSPTGLGSLVKLEVGWKKPII